MDIKNIQNIWENVRKLDLDSKYFQYFQELSKKILGKKMSKLVYKDNFYISKFKKTE